MSTRSDSHKAPNGDALHVRVSDDGPIEFAAGGRTERWRREWKRRPVISSARAVEGRQRGGRGLTVVWSALALPVTVSDTVFDFTLPLGLPINTDLTLRVVKEGPRVYIDKSGRPEFTNSGNVYRQVAVGALRVKRPVSLPDDHFGPDFCVLADCFQCVEQGWEKLGQGCL
ncbi:impact family protein [Coprinopsis cinerea okayama7|uniref:Impact family protein n=1 Tax=Coprinopsis cinerea (strain Okayama-7 / 130 / ATCC MYA-4618 / FGSC 9003) TaxID=240176 RepID=D6RLD6_COPC7|nr:impact family protein [Coprinopsis cinerea okayama7\|eukprot:XP_002911657.1 impact family protein [Coprinopsis cinerea okayama7\